MHTFSDTGAGVPAFLAKLWRLVEDPETNNLICWSKDGRSFIIQNQAQFARELLPLNYKHNNMASFIRQLNMYGFHKITSIDNGGLKFDRDDMEFSHPCFKRNCPYLLEHIKRKIANTKSIDEKATVKSEAVSKVLSDVKAMRGRQDSLDSRFSVMKQENEALWREIASLRQKHAKQQQIVNKLIQFLITIVQPSRNNMTSVKRHMQLMINDTPEQAKLRKPSESGSECGPVIHELGEELFDEANNVDDDSDLDAPMSPYVNLPSVGSSNMDNENDSPVPKTERPQSNGSIHSQLFDYSNQSVDDARSAAGNITPGHSGAVINAVNADGSQIVYHVTELADSAPQTPEAVINEENHLTTPMVKEMNRNQMPQIKPKSNKRKIGNVSSTVTTSTSSSPATKMLRSSGNGTSPLLIKTEKNDVDPMAFWNNANFSPSGGVVENISATGNDALASPSSSTLNMNTTLDPRLISPLNDQATKITSDAVDMYNADNFIASDMPSQLFEGESPIIDDANILGGGSYNSKFDFRPSASSSGRSSQQKSTQSVGKFADFGNEELSSTSKNNNSKLQLSKVNNGNNLNPNDLREEVTMHLDTVQDDLETLKDLLRTDSYALDANTLMGNGTPPGGRIYIPPQLEADFFTKLFNDSDILGPYGLGMAPDQQDKKGSELMTYQPIYDLSDIIDINKDNEDTSTNGSNAKPMSPASSVLNTPYHE